MIKLAQAVIVEGKYDKIKVSALVDAPILQTDGFRIFKDKEKMALIRAFAQTTGVIILTDSDTAGFQIRNYLKGSIPKGKIYHAYIPDILGKERRKKIPSKEGKLGVEGMQLSILQKALEQAGVTAQKDVPKGPAITKADFFDDGLSGGQQSVQKRAKLIKALGLPEHLSANALLCVLNTLYGYARYKEEVAKL